MALMTSPASGPNASGISSGDGPTDDGGVSFTFPCLTDVARRGAAYILAMLTKATLILSPPLMGRQFMDGHLSHCPAVPSSFSDMWSFWQSV